MHKAHVCGKQSVWHLSFKLVPTRLLWKFVRELQLACENGYFSLANCENTGFQMEGSKVQISVYGILTLLRSNLARHRRKAAQ